jgi:hypothetical protein
MSVEMIFNELSLESRARDIHQARQWMSQFIQTLRAAVSVGTEKILRTDELFQNAELCEDYTLPQWRNDREVDFEARRLLKTLTTKRPYLVGLPDAQAEVRYSGRVALGFGYAHVLEALAVSLCSAIEWEAELIDLAYSQVVESESDAEIQSLNIQVHHCSAAEHAAVHEEWIQARRTQSVRDGRDLWTRRDELFQKLIFCDSIEKSLISLCGSDPFEEISKWLFKLEGYCQNWRSGSFSPGWTPHSFSPDSEATLKKYSDKRTFLCPDGERRLFSFHIKLSFNNWRLYFYPLPQSHTIIIGYVGPHLQTVTYG